MAHHVGGAHSQAYCMSVLAGVRSHPAVGPVGRRADRLSGLLFLHVRAGLLQCRSQQHSLLVTLVLIEQFDRGGSHPVCHTGVSARAGLSGPARLPLALPQRQLRWRQVPRCRGEGGCCAQHRPPSHLCAVSLRWKAEAGSTPGTTRRRAPYSTLTGGGGLNRPPHRGGGGGGCHLQP